MSTRKKIPFAGPSITQKEIDYVVDGVKNGFYDTDDQHTRRLEKAVCDYLGVKHGLATHCCTPSELYFTVAKSFAVVEVGLTPVTYILPELSTVIATGSSDPLVGLLNDVAHCCETCEYNELHSVSNISAMSR